jgi:hypothetical protein
MNEMAGNDKLTQKAKDWLLAILRFAVTLEPADRAAVLKIASELDRPGTDPTSAKFAFFTRTSSDFCNAISDKNNPERTAILRRHIARIEDSRLKRALEAAVDSGADQCGSYRAMRAEPKKRWQSDLWKGLPSARHS